MSLRVHLRLPKQGTTAFAQFTDSVEQLIHFIVVTSQHAERVDATRKIAAKALGDFGGASEQHRAEWEKIKEEGVGPAVKKLREFTDLQRKTTFATGVDYFLGYISNLLKIIHSTRSEILRIDEKISFSEVAQFTKMRDLTDYLIEKRVMDLTFKSITQLQREVESKHGFQIMRTESSLRTVARQVEKRNLLVHNSGIVNRRYIDRSGSRRQRVGEAVELGSVIDMIRHLRLAAASADARAIQKFRIRRPNVIQIKSRFRYD